MICLLTAFTGMAADSLMLIRSIPLSGRLMTVDETGSVYVVKADNELVRYDEKGDSTGVFRSVQNGQIGFVDAVNPLRIVVYYPAYSKVVLLDRMMTPRHELDLRRIGIFNTPAVAASADGNLWIYDRFNARLKKIDEQLREVNSSNDLRQEVGVVPELSNMTERDWKVFLSDTAQGIFIFDRYGNYINTLSIPGAAYFQVSGSRMLYSRGDTLFAWDMQRMVSQSLHIPDLNHTPVIRAALVRNILYVLYADRLALYRVYS